MIKNIDIKNPFVAEVIRIVKEACPYSYGPHTIVLVSEKFFDEANVEIDKCKQISGEDCPEKEEYMQLCRCRAYPAHWLLDYQFEIRPYFNWKKK